MYRLDVICFTAPFQFDRETMREAAEAPAAIVVIVDGKFADEMAGFVIVHLQGAGAGKYAYVITIDVAPDSRRGGIGSKVLKHAENEARAAGAMRIGLHVATDNASAIQFYERELYQRTGMAKRFYREAGLDALIYQKAL
jgi:[ribosomal protein S18]-alanine N-acetyltransferase